jgi:hypothetical protein
MRKSVLAICVLVPAACLILICQSAFRPESIQTSAERAVEPEANPPVPGSELASDVSLSKQATQPTPAPDWETSFGDIASRGGPLQSEDLELLAATVPDDQVQGALDKLAEDQSRPALTLIGFLARRWATNSPAEAAQWAAAHLGDNDLSHDVFRKIMVPWAGKDLAGAAAWVEQLPPGGNETAAAAALALEAAAQKDAATAINLAVNIPPGPERDGLLNYSAQQWATTDRNGAVAWINQVQDPALREKMLGEVAVNLGIQDPVAGANFVATALPEGPDRDNAAVNIVRFWAASAPADAAAWVEQFPDGQLRDTAMANLVEVWGKDDFTGAGAWLDQLPAGSSRDAAVNIYSTIQSNAVSEGGFQNP